MQVDKPEYSFMLLLFIKLLHLWLIPERQYNLTK